MGKFEINSREDVIDAVNAVVEYNAKLHSQKSSFERSRRIGFGTSPGILVIDLANVWTKPGSPYVCDDMDVIIPATRKLLDVGREKRIPIAFTTMAYTVTHGPNSDQGIFQGKWSSEYFQEGTEAVDLDTRLGRRSDEQFCVKKRPSAFHGTYLSGYFKAAGVDTIIVTGVTASGCVRNSCEDAIAEGFRPIAVRECIGDRVPGVTEWNLFDIDAKFGDVESLDTVVEYLDGREARDLGEARLQGAGTAA